MKLFLKKHIWKLSVCIVASMSLAFFCFTYGPLSYNHDPSTIPSIEESESSDVVTAVVHTSLLPMSQEDLTELSHLVMTCKLLEISPAFQVKSVGGGITNFTYYYFQPIKILRDSRSITSEDIVTVRIQGGQVGNLNVVNDTSYGLEEEKEYLLFLYSPTYGGGFTTEGDYYCLTGSQQGVFALENNISRSENSVYANINLPSEEEPITLSSFQTTIAQINQAIPPKDAEESSYQRFLDAQKENLESGFISQEEYNQFLEESKQYATILTNEPSYSGD